MLSTVLCATGTVYNQHKLWFRKAKNMCWGTVIKTTLRVDRLLSLPILAHPLGHARMKKIVSMFSTIWTPPLSSFFPPFWYPSLVTGSFDRVYFLPISVLKPALTNGLEK